ncbi:hypothetical protein [Candidatus Nitrosocosmicus sp. R]
MQFVSQSGEPTSIRGFNGTLYSKSRGFLENNKLPDTTQNNNFSTLIFSNPLYLSNDTLMLGKIPLETSNTINREAQFFVERGIINTSMVTYKVGYYIKDSEKNGSNSDSIPLSIDHKSKTGPNYADGSGIFLTENGGTIEWDEFYQIINKSAGKVPYSGMIFFLLLLTRMMNYLYLKIDWDRINFQSIMTLPLFVLHSAYTTNSDTSTHRTIWFWSNTTN